MVGRDYGCKLLIQSDASGLECKFIGHPDVGWRNAVLYSIIGSCRRRGINPREYLTDILGRLPATEASCLHELLPANWKAKSTDSG